MFKSDSEDGLEEKRKSQKTRQEVTVHRTDLEEPEVIKNVQLIHDGVEGWTLFEQVDGTQNWRQDQYLAGYDDPEGTA